jgi:hypothetical protein
MFMHDHDHGCMQHTNRSIGVVYDIAALRDVPQMSNNTRKFYSELADNLPLGHGDVPQFLQRTLGRTLDRGEQELVLCELGQLANLAQCNVPEVFLQGMIGMM